MSNEGKVEIDKTALVRRTIKHFKSFYFGKKDFECRGFEQSKDYYLRTNKLPEPCDECYMVSFLWDSSSDVNMTNFFKIIDFFEVNYTGKLDNEVTVFYFRDKDKMLTFLDYLRKRLNEFNLKSKIEWRRACNDFQVLKPELWIDAKIFIPDLEPAR